MIRGNFVLISVFLISIQTGEFSLSLIAFFFYLFCYENTYQVLLSINAFDQES